MRISINKPINKEIEKYFRFTNKNYVNCKQRCCKEHVCQLPYKCCSQWKNINLNYTAIEKIKSYCEKTYSFELFVDDFIELNTEEVDE